MYEFTQDFFSMHIPNWTKWFESAKGNPVTVLEIGSFEGRSAVWMLENALDHPDSSLTCVDTWQGSQSTLAASQNDDIFARFNNNIASHSHKVKVKRGRSCDMLKTIDLLSSRFDWIYIDGDHDTHAVLEDAVLAWPLLKLGGVMLFDDYSCGGPKPAIDAFVKCYYPKLQILYCDHLQLLLKKTAL